MAKEKDFYGKDIAEVIEQACREIGASREDLDIEVLETGSAGIFGLCKKKAHIRVQRKAVPLSAEIAPPVPATPVKTEEEAAPSTSDEPQTVEAVAAVERVARPAEMAKVVEEQARPQEEAGEEGADGDVESFEEDIAFEPPSAENLGAIQEDLHQLLTLMRLPSEVRVSYEDNTVQCHISGAHEEHIVGPEGRTLDSLQYLLRKMVSRHLPDRIMLALNVGDFRERRAEELKARAVQLAELVKADGKTQAIPALNPSERRVVHMVLQEDKGVRSRSVGEGLFKKVLIYKPGKGRRPVAKKRRGGQGGRPSGE
ncbi:single-stranded nucleic acid binding R3H domain-containing protein [Desulfobulbus propionicus DSM 2032]|uniref:RNA-binding protein KhpB n=1 Tax=Desulfobulbus propionicus (strain ATCC 33891 / DSM 2032 / VKM B-1956 / 1pr3) TaxID=577650 RepID=A0A7U3YNT0_DESPD|nr:Jag N-terminal domain-containing protein [Desulfobulbus propionicus]ADW18767.1 single-stranded nucleic acid binding R3H domain-containing protein [Desulfobulbus propionicus DSM 2032]